MVPRLSFCLLLTLIHAARPASEVQINASLNSIGACPPDRIISWTTVAPPWPRATLTYKLFCCGTKNKELCASPENYLLKLKTLKCCERSASRSGILLSCNITSALQRFKIYQPHATIPGPQVVLYSVFQIIDGSENYTRFSRHHFHLDLGKIICTEPRNFNATVDRENLTFYWTMPPRMYCESFKFNLRYSRDPDNCSNNSNQPEAGQVFDDTDLTYHKGDLQQKKFIKTTPVDSVLTSFRDYWFTLTCDMYSDIKSIAARVRVKRLSRIPAKAPRDLLPQRQKYFKEKRNVTLTWKAPSALCPAEWNGRPVKFRLRYFKTRNSSSDATPPNHGNDVNESNDVTSVNISPSSNSAVIGDLDRFQEYTVRLAMCTDAGCGPDSPTRITADPEPTGRIQRKTDAGARWRVILAALLMAGGFATVVIVILVLYIRKRRSTEDSEGPAQPPLEELVGGIGPYSPYSAPIQPLTQDSDVYVESSRWLLEESESSLESKSD